MELAITSSEKMIMKGQLLQVSSAVEFASKCSQMDKREATSSRSSILSLQMKQNQNCALHNGCPALLKQTLGEQPSLTDLPVPGTAALSAGSHSIDPI